MTKVVGIDLGTTNSAVAVVQDGRPRLIPIDGELLLPSYVGFDTKDKLLVGQVARNQYALYPERTVRSIKRKMGEAAKIPLGTRSYSPEELSGILLRRLKQGAEAALGGPVDRAVITVPAFFTDAQRTATRDAGRLAGFQVERILNEPTAAALCYIAEEGEDRTFLVYDLGGGTFDVSIVRVRGKITEVLSSHGDTALGGDDFDELLKAHLLDTFQTQNKLSSPLSLQAEARLYRAAEEAKIALSTDSYVHVIEEHLVTQEGVGIHLNTELSRPAYEDMIRSLAHKTRHSIQTALQEANLLVSDIDEVILVGGSTRTPLISEILTETTGKQPRCDVNPEHAVALGAALQAARIDGDSEARILVDVSPFSFGTSYFGELNAGLSPHAYRPVIKRNSPIPCRQTEIFYTMFDGQEKVQVDIFQGEEKDARQNLLLGSFRVENLDPKAPESSPILFEFQLDINGILKVEVTEKHTGLQKGIQIEDAFRQMNDEEIERARKHITSLLGEIDSSSDGFGPGIGAALEIIDADEAGLLNHQDETPSALASHPLLQALTPPDTLSQEQQHSWTKAKALLEKTVHMLPDVPEMDREEVQEYADSLREAMVTGSFDAIQTQSDALADVLFYLE